MVQEAEFTFTWLEWIREFPSKFNKERPWVKRRQGRRMLGPFKAVKWMVTACIAVVTCLRFILIFSLEFYYIINGKRKRIVNMLVNQPEAVRPNRAKLLPSETIRKLDLWNCL